MGNKNQIARNIQHDYRVPRYGRQGLSRQINCGVDENIHAVIRAIAKEVVNIDDQAKKLGWRSQVSGEFAKHPNTAGTPLGHWGLKS